MQPAFDENALLHKLRTLSIKGQRAFGALCCERLVPNYEAFCEEVHWGRPAVLRQALDLVWHDLNNESTSPDEVRGLISECEFVAPTSEQFTSLRVTSAQDACFAICSLLDHVLSPEAEKIAVVARYATDSVDLFVQESENMRPDAPDLERMILTHPLMQRELTEQTDDIDTIREAVALASSSVGNTPLAMLRRHDVTGNLASE
ncbi:MAG: DUF416 family protein [Telluria sp.]